MWNIGLAREGAVLIWIQNELRCAVLDGLFSFYTKLGDAGLIWISLSVLMLIHPKTRKAGLLGLGAMLMGLVCTNLILKPLVHRVRPWLVVDGLRVLVAEEDPHSFPSGHTCAAFAAACVWRRCLPKRWMGNAMLVLAALMGFSRLYVGVHFPSDVLVGACVGGLCGWAARRIYIRLDRRLPGYLP